MKKALCLAILLVGAAVGYAASGINIYITAEDDPSGDGQIMINDGGERFNQDRQDFLPYANFDPSGSALKPVLTNSPFEQQLGTTKTYYLWADMSVDPNSVASATRIQRVLVYGLDLTGCYAVSTNTIGQSSEYRHYNSLVSQPRWDDADLQIPCFTGLQSVSGCTGLPTGYAGDLQYVIGAGGTAVTHALLGAFEFNANQVGDGLKLGLGSIFAAVRTYRKSGSQFVILNDYDSVSGGDYPSFTFQGVPYHRGTDAQVAITVVPEPASMLLIGLAGLLIRRR